MQDPATDVLARLVTEVVGRSTIAGSILHGEEHWRRVAWHGLAIVRAEGAGDPLVAVLFGLFHDAMRINDGADPEHGERGAALARRLLPGLGLVSAEQLAALDRACADHTKGMTTDDPTIGACWDADRLDLCRLAIVPHPAKLSTAWARRQEALWAARALLGRPPTWDEVWAELAV